MTEYADDLQSVREQAGRPPNVVDWAMLEEVGISPAVDDDEYQGQLLEYRDELLDAYPASANDMPQEARDVLVEENVQYAAAESGIYDEFAADVSSEDELHKLPATVGDDIRQTDAHNIDDVPVSFVTFTSGSTGVPKRTKYSQIDALTNAYDNGAMQQDMLDLDEGDAGVNYLPGDGHLIGRAYDNFMELTGASSIGAPVAARGPEDYVEHIQNEYETNNDEIQFVAAAPTAPGKAPNTVPAMLKTDKMSGDTDVFGEVLDGKVIQGGGAPWDVDVLQQVLNGDNGPEAVINGYGTCELGGTFSEPGYMAEKVDREDGVAFASGVKQPAHWAVVYREDEDTPQDWQPIEITPLGRQKSPLVNYQTGDWARNGGDTIEDIVRSDWVQHDESSDTYRVEVPSDAGTCVSEL